MGVKNRNKKISTNSITWIFIVTLALGSLVLPSSTIAQSRNQTLSQGASLLSTFRGRGSKNDAMLDRIDKAMPPTVQSQSGKSTWLQGQAIESRSDLQSKLNDPKTVILKGGDGQIYGVPRKDASRILDRAINQVVGHPDFVNIHKDTIGKLTSKELAALRKKLGKTLGSIVNSPVALGKAVEAANVASMFSPSKSAGNLALAAIDRNLTDWRNRLGKDLAAGKPIPGLNPGKPAGTPVAFNDKPLLAAFKNLQGKASQVKSEQAKLAQACSQMNSPASHAKKVSLIKTLPEPPGIKNTLRSELVLITRLKAIAAEMDQIDNSALNDADAACTASRTSEPNVNDIKKAATRTRQAQQRMEALYKEAQKIHGKLKTLLADETGFISGHAYLAQLNNDTLAKLKPQLMACIKPAENWKSISQQSSNVAGSAKQIINEARAQLRKAEAANYPGKDKFKQQLASLISILQSATGNDANLRRRCDALQSKLVEACKQRAKEQSNLNVQKAATYSAARKNILGGRRSQLAQADDLFGKMQRLVTRVYIASRGAEGCVAQAETKKPTGPDPKDAARAAQLGNFSDLKCDAGSIKSRISELKKPGLVGLQGTSGKIGRLENKLQLIRAARRAFRQAKNAFDAGNSDGAKQGLARARQALSQLNGEPVCPKLAGRIGKGEQQTAQLDEILTAAQNALNTCDAGQMRATSRQIGKKTKPQRLVSLRARIQWELKAIDFLNQAKKLSKAGKVSEAFRAFNQARNWHAVANLKSCSGIDAQIASGISNNRWPSAIREETRQAGASCNMPKLKNLKRRLKERRGPLVKSFNYEIGQAIQVCRRAETDRQAERDREEREESLRAAGQRQATCREKYGVGYRPGKVDKNGKFYCLPSRNTANAWCRSNNKGRGWRAVKFTGRGGFGCRQSSRVVARDARSDCRRQYGRRYSHTVMKKSGRYTCYFCPRGQYARKGRCYSRRATARRTPRYTCPRGYYLRGKRCYPRQNSADVARAAGQIIGAIIRGGNRRNPEARRCPRGYYVYRGRCHRRVTTTRRPPQRTTRTCRRGTSNRPIRCPRGKTMWISQTTRTCRYYCS